MSFAGLVVLARSLNPIPSRTRPLNSSAPMVLWLKPWESRSLPGLPRTKQFLFTCHDQTKRRFLREVAFFVLGRSYRQIFFCSVAVLAKVRTSSRSHSRLRLFRVRLLHRADFAVAARIKVRAARSLSRRDRPQDRRAKRDHQTLNRL